MRVSGFLGLSMMLLAVATTAVFAAELKSGLQPGDSVGPFEVEKVAGAVNDGREVGTSFCYRCMLGNKPVVMVFAKKADGSLAKLVGKLEKQIDDHADQKLSSFVNLIGPNADTLKATAKDFAEKNKLKNVALVVPQDNENGPEDYGINPEAEFTVLIYRQGIVAANHAVPPGKLSDQEIDAILADTDKILN